MSYKTSNVTLLGKYQSSYSFVVLLYAAVIASSHAKGVGSSASAANIIETRSVQPIRNVLNGEETASSNQPIKAYVVESEITQTQNKRINTEKEATF